MILSLLNIYGLIQFMMRIASLLIFLTAFIMNTNAFKKAC
jgi:hypothetical protein